MSELLSGQPLAELLAIRAHLVRQWHHLGPELIEGSLTVIGVKCGHPGCRCARGEKHLKHILTRKVEGKTHTTYIPQELLAEVQQWNAQYKQAKQLLKAIAAVNEAIVRGHARRQHQAGPPEAAP